MEEVQRLEQVKDTTLDSLVVRQHTCTKKLLAADQVLRGVLQRDKRLTTAWAMWGKVQKLLGNTEKAAEAYLTSLEWDRMSSFDSVGTCDIVIWLVWNKYKTASSRSNLPGS